MTSLSTETVVCASCNTSSEQHVVTSTNRRGSYDLDSRPPEMERSTLRFGVQHCPHCGYCAQDLSEDHPSVVNALSSDTYHDIWKDYRLGELAKNYLCACIIKEISGDYAGAEWCALRAAWASDDHGSGGQRCRRRAANLLLCAQKHGQLYAEDEETENMILIDVLRRSRQFTRASERCGQVMDRQPEKTVRKILEFQVRPIATRDWACYTVAEAIEK